MTQIDLPFKVGHILEVRSFELGFRGAWFRCKITSIIKKKGRALTYKLKYIDYAGEGIHTTKVFQNREGGNEKYLMVRPPYPRKYHENEIQNKEVGVEEAVVVNDFWKVGDLVDWWTDHCFWSGTVLEVRENGSLKIELLPPPYGEGEAYDVVSEDLRPSLEWSLEEGWSVPFSEDGQKRQCAKLMKVSNEDQEKRNDPFHLNEESEATSIPSSSKKLSSETGEEQIQRTTKKLKGDGNGDGDLLLNIMESEAIEAPVFDLEELVVRIQWLKEMLVSDGDNSSTKFSWKYEDYCPSSS